MNNFPQGHGNDPFGAAFSANAKSFQPTTSQQQPRNGQAPFNPQQQQYGGGPYAGKQQNQSEGAGQWQNGGMYGASMMSKQPAGALPDNSFVKQTSDNTPANDLRLLVLANKQCSFYYMVAQQNQKDVPFRLVLDQERPTYQQVRCCKFSPLEGKLAAIASEHGLFVYDVDGKSELMLMVQLDIQALEWSPCDNYIICCEKYNMQKPQPNLFVFSARTGQTLAKFEWKKNPAEAMKSLRFSADEQYCFFLVPQYSSKEVNQIQIYKDGNFQEPLGIIKAQFSQKALQAQKKGIAPTLVNGRFDGIDPCPLNPADPSRSPFYLFSWQNAAELATEDDNGQVYVYDILSGKGAFERSKFQVTCPRGQQIQTILSPTGHAALVWSQNLHDSTGKSYYGEHSLQYVQVHGGRDRQFIPVFDNLIQDVAWYPNGENFILISGIQPATATLYDKNATPLFEFGKRYRNTIRICPFNQLALIGGFGNLPGEADFWQLDNLSQLCTVKSECAVGIEWAPDGLNLMTSVLYERVKVDNMLSIITPSGKKLLGKQGTPYTALGSVQWQPRPPKTYKKPAIAHLAKEAAVEQEKKPKRLWNQPGGQNSAFSQLMRQHMSKESDKGPRKLDANSKQEYQALGNQLASEAKESVQAIQTQKQNQAAQGKQYEESKEPVANWRLGNFSENTPKPQKKEKAFVEQQMMMQQPQNNTTAMQMSMYDQSYANQQVGASQEAKMSKHAKRRANKRARQAEAEAQQDPNQQQQQ